MSSIESNNKSGSLIFGLVFVATILFFLYVLAVNQGPLDQTMWDWGTTFSEQERVDRNNMWRTSTPEAVERGEKLFAVNIFGEREDVFAAILDGKYGTNEVDLYRVITEGIPQTSHRGMDFLPQDVRWDMVHYIRSRMDSPKRATQEDWDELDNEGI